MSSPVFTGLRKCEFIQDLGKGLGLAKDLLTGELIEVQLTARQRMHYMTATSPEKMYVKYSDFRQVNCCRMETHFKDVRSSIWEERIALDDKLKKLGLG